MSKTESIRSVLGDLAPVRDVLTWLHEREEQLRTLNVGDPALHLVTEARKRLTAALDAAQNPDLEVSVDEWAQQEGVSRWSVYKRIQRGTLAARKRGGHLRIPVNQAA